MPAKLPSSRRRRSRAKEGPGFVFVNAAIGLAHRPRDDGRVQIRRQAARSGRKHCRRKGVGQEDTKTSVNNTNINVASSSLAASKQVESPALQNDDDSPLHNHALVPRRQSLSAAYETLRIKYNFDITDPTTFTYVDLGRAASLLLQDQPTLFPRLF